MKMHGKGLRLFILKSKLGSCSNGGISEFHDDVTWVDGPLDTKVFEVKPDAPAVVIVEEDLGFCKMFRAYPADREPGEHYMFGGTYVDSSDSRFTQRFGGPVKLFDRTEG